MRILMKRSHGERNKFAVITAILFFGGLWVSAAASAEILTLYADNGQDSVAHPLFIWPQAPTQTAGVAVDTNTLISPEGYQCIQSSPPPGYAFAGWGVFNDLTTNPTGVNYSRFQNGELRFWLYTSILSIAIEVEDYAHNKTSFSPVWSNLANYTPTIPLNQWTLVRLPLSQVPLPRLSQAYSPFEITLTGPPGSVFYVDNVRYVDSTVPPDLFGVDTLTIGTGANTSASMTFTSPAAGGWKIADQMVRLTLDPSWPSWGVQVYTNNMGPAANPKFTPEVPPGLPGSNPAGLVNVAAPSLRLPLAWKIEANSAAATQAWTPDWVTGDPAPGVRVALHDGQRDDLDDPIGEQSSAFYERNGLRHGRQSLRHPLGPPERRRGGRQSARISFC